MPKNDFTWVETHNELVQYLRTKEHNQIELIDLLKSVGIDPFNDKLEEGDNFVDLEEIDPFTFFCYIYKYGNEKRLNLLQEIAKKLDLSIPIDEKGLPSAQPQRVWLFPFKYLRTHNEIQRLWDFFNKAVENNIYDSDFEDIITIKSIGLTKITEVLFYIKPEKYLPINGPTKSYIEQELNIIPTFKTYSEYIKLLEIIKSKSPLPFYELSFKAWEWNHLNKVEKKENQKFSPQLIKFLEQAKTDNLKTKDFLKEFNQTKVKVSFGQGVVARIPWISFLKSPNTTSDGIYPVYLYYKNINILILSYGISETNTPNVSWDIENPKTISKYFSENDLGVPDRYGKSYIYRVYEVSKLPELSVLDNDLNQLLKFYLNTMDNVIVNSKTIKFINFDKESLISSLDNAGLIFNPELVSRFIASLITKPFVILTGLSGSGKTKLAQAFVQWICNDKNQYSIVPVGADWTNREPLLGYPNALNPEEYVKPDSGVLDLIIRANNNLHLPHFLILDEMNLSHVERYFADFLSVMESKEKILLHSNDNDKNGIDGSLYIPSNLFIIGTVNIDETTNMFSPKVLDRANTIEFRVTENEMKNFLSNIKEVNMEFLLSKGADMAESFLEMAENKSFEEIKKDEINKTLLKFFGELKKTGAEFGYRSGTEILRLIQQLTIIDPDLTNESKLDIAIMQKLLPKLHGSRRKLCSVLETLGSFCIVEEVKIIKDVFEKADFEIDNNSKVIYPLSLEKITRMYKAAIDNGFTSFAEA